MNLIKKMFLILRISFVKHVLFWIGIFAYFIITTELQYFGDYTEAIESRSILILFQMVTAYSCLYILIPFFLVPKKYFLFSLSFLFLLVVIYFLFVCSQEFYYQPKYFTSTDASIKYDTMKGFWDHIFKIELFLGKSVKFLTPTIILLTVKFYQDQQKYLQLNEQKKATELTTLKHQLNPHFLFNTLNNLYSLAVIKSDEAPEVIEKLSEMLDHMLYGCDEKFVSLDKEIELIENYLALEKVRYSDRVDIVFKHKAVKNVKVAPLLFLTFVENAFKHGVSQELEKANIQIEIIVKENQICFTVSNTIAINKVHSNKEGIGLKNVKKQLELLYPKEYSLSIKEEINYYTISLKLLSK
jgi:sensor histidine kinase YesM